jgi:hypothetical protein
MKWPRHLSALIIPRHPSEGVLLAWVQGESAIAGPEVGAHVAQCPRCRRRAAELRQDWNGLAALFPLALEAAPSEASLRAAFTAVAPAWPDVERLLAPVGDSAAAASADVETLAAYFGPQAARMLVAQKPPEEVRALLRMWLGRSAAEAAMSATSWMARGA